MKHHHNSNKNNRQQRHHQRLLKMQQQQSRSRIVIQSLLLLICIHGNFFNNSSGCIIGVGVMGLPRNNIPFDSSSTNNCNNNRRNNNVGRRQQHGGDKKSSINSSGGGGQRRTAASASSRSSTALHDEFPCEPSSVDSLPSSTLSSEAATLSSEATSSSGQLQKQLQQQRIVSFTNNSFARMNNIDETAPSPSSLSATTTASSLAGNVASKEAGKATSASTISTTSKAAAMDSLNTRGGGIGGTQEGGVDMDDDEIDQMVDDLINGLDDDNDEEESEEEEIEEGESEEEDEIEESDEVGEEEEMEDDDEEEELEEEDQVADASTEDEKEEMSSNNNQKLSGDNDEHKGAKATQSKSTSSRSPPPLPLTTPTNAYYRFLLRRGPKGHFLASLTLISIQWIYIYIPLLYKSASSILLKLHIYDSRVLWDKDRQKRYEEELRRRGIFPSQKKKKKGMLGIFGSSSSKKEQNVQQQRNDLRASQTLKQLYKAIKSGEGADGALSEVKYRYLSSAFRRKYGLGKEYRVEKPMSFMGEVVEGDAHLQSVSGDEGGGIDEVVFSDGEELVVEDSIEGQATSSKQQQQQKQKRKRKRINDWVVQSFINRSKPTTSSSLSKQQQESSLWKTVEHSAIIQAAWEGRAAEQLAWQKKRGTRPKKSGNGDHDNEDDEEDDEESLLPDVAESNSGYGASKMFQSVMTRSMAAVGSNGRLPGAYPMDALPIEECANRRGVLDLGRRYGYGDWSNNYNDDVGDYSEKEDELFGGGDLFAVESASRRKRKSRRNKKSHSAPSMDNGRRRRRKKASSLKLGMSGGGASDGRRNHRVSFEFDMRSSHSHRTASSRRREPSISTPTLPRRLEMNDVKSKLSERNILFTSDSRVKAPTELLRKSKLRKSDDEL